VKNIRDYFKQLGGGKPGYASKSKGDNEMLIE